MTRCRCQSSSHGPHCALVDYFDPVAEELECQRIEAEMRAAPPPRSCARCVRHSWSGTALSCPECGRTDGRLPGVPLVLRDAGGEE